MNYKKMLPVLAVSVGLSSNMILVASAATLPSADLFQMSDVPTSAVQQIANDHDEHKCGAGKCGSDDDEEDDSHLSNDHDDEGDDDHDSHLSNDHDDEGDDHDGHGDHLSLFEMTEVVASALLLANHHEDHEAEDDQKCGADSCGSDDEDDDADDAEHKCGAEACGAEDDGEDN